MVLQGKWKSEEIEQWDFFFFFFDLLWKDSERKSNGWSKENVGKIVTLCNVRHRQHL